MEECESCFYHDNKYCRFHFMNLGPIIGCKDYRQKRGA
jgi:hypothetical protein